MLKFRSNRETLPLSPDNTSESKIVVYIHDIVEVIKPHKVSAYSDKNIFSLQLNLKVFDTAVTLKYGQGH